MNPTIEPTGFVYVIHAVGTNRIKIGHTKDLKGRQKGLQTAAPYPLQMLANWPGTKARERRVHRCLSQFRKVGEWFEVPPFTIGYQVWQLVTQGEVTGAFRKKPTKKRACRVTSENNKWPEGGPEIWRIERNGKYYFFRNRFNRSTQPGGRVTREIEIECAKRKGKGRHKKSRVEAEQFRSAAEYLAKCIRTIS